MIIIRSLVARIKRLILLKKNFLETKDLNKAAWTSSKLEAGQVYVNKWFTGSHATPFGGYKQSGYSREKGQQALNAYLQIKNVGISLS